MFSLFIENVLPYFIFFVMVVAPPSSIVLFTVGLICYLSAKSKRKKLPDSVSEEQILKLKGYLKISAVLLAVGIVLIGITVGIILLIGAAVAYM